MTFVHRCDLARLNRRPQQGRFPGLEVVVACARFHYVQLEGDFVECGVYRATGIKTVVDYLGGKDFPKQFYGYDSFDHNPVEGHAFEGQDAGFYEKVQQRFDGYPQVHLIRGFIADSFKISYPEKIAYLHGTTRRAIEGERGIHETSK
jgi:O-methyltransferase